MKNKIFNHAIIICCFMVCLFPQVNATTVTWLGGDGNWENELQWDTQKVPQEGDDVIIPSGRARLHAGTVGKTRSMHIVTGAVVKIYDGATLNIYDLDNSAALYLEGRINVHGQLFIYNIHSPGATDAAYAIHNTGDFYVYQTGFVDISGIEDKAIANLGDAYFRSSGKIKIRNIQTTAIENELEAYIRNWGLLTVSNSTAMDHIYMINNQGRFRNEKEGKIVLDSNVFGGIRNPGKFYNHGTLAMTEIAVAISSNGKFWNYGGAILSADYAVSGFFNQLNGNCKNYGEMYFTNSFRGIYNHGKFQNYDYILAELNITGIGQNYPTGSIYNHGVISSKNSSALSFSNHGLFVNATAGTFLVDDRFSNGTGSETLNDGFLWTDYIGNNPIIGTFQNNGVIDDNYGNLQGQVTNKSVIVAPYDQPMYVNQPAYDVVDFYQGDPPAYFTVESPWYSSPTSGVSVGDYNIVDNIFVPNQNALGLTTIYFRVLNNATGVWRYHSLELDEEVYASPQPRLQNATAEAELEHAKSTITVFPNPSNGQVQLTSTLWESQSTQVEVYTALGELVQTTLLETGSLNNQLELSSRLANGFYLLRFSQDGKTVGTERLQLHRN